MSLRSEVDELMRIYNDRVGGMNPAWGPYHRIFEDFFDLPDASSFDPALENLTVAMSRLSPGHVSSDPVSHQPFNENMILRDVAKVGRELGEWLGTAYDTFHDNFQVPFPGISHNLFIATAVLRGAVNAEKAMWYSARNDAYDIVRKAKAGTEAIGATNGAQAAFILAIIGSVVSVGMGGAAAASANAVNGIFQVAGNGAQVDWSARNETDVFKEAEKAVNQVKAKITEHEQAISKALTSVTGWLNDKPRDYSFVDIIALNKGPGGIEGRR